MADRGYTEGSFFEILISRALHKPGERYPELKNLIYSEDGMSFSGFGSTAKHLEKTKKILVKALKAMIANKKIDQVAKERLKSLLLTTESATKSGTISDLVRQALDVTHPYKEQL
jgi:hypothetical protein